MSKYIHKSHNVSVLMYHIVCPSKYRRVVFDDKVDAILKEVCREISDRYEIEFIEIGTDRDHVHFLIQTIPTYKPSEVVKKIRSITAREIFRRAPEVKKILWGGEFWSKGYFISTVGRRGNEQGIAHYVKSQGREKEYKLLHKQAVKQGQVSLWENI